MKVVLVELLSPKECDAVVARAPVRAAAEVDRGAGLVVDVAIRRSRAVFLDDPALTRRLNDALVDVNYRHFGFGLAGNEPLQFAEYGIGDKYDDHLDIGPGAAALRKLSVSVQLTDPSTYDGGDLHIWGTGRVDRTRGIAIVFPSYLVHRVEPVTRGVRHSLVAWAVGATPYR